ncbi:FGGY-family carbohydrate kinase [Phycicoccus endophyticus]|uniref:FGGY-family carbohydrate kinase n=1 Tax=Phycicoccus endophyticus TaxID=1690220 RepID=A0A7G9QYN2_9MICO|nr:FGGY-family carbohydrate kinase [Phycicoccus endophyticus]NHI20509.1 FGGY-family carbohydrate kinase [Phycicoccus endophyticus]QNN48457.1 FGGY-family carbohydrate kinase [Phycicoccus endophyticus]GGL30166.1 sugar kinase [Phycicoccus endophyticus]
MSEAGPLVLGIDLGTGSSKGVLATLEGKVVATATVPRPSSMSLPRPGWAEVDAEAVWWTDVCSIGRQLAAQAAHRACTVAALCVSGVGPCLLPTDARAVPLRPAILYGIDMRATAEIDELTRRYGDDTVLQVAGTPLTTQAVGPKALWLRHNEPEVWSRTREWHTSTSYVVRRLTGEYVMDHHTASQSVPLYDLARESWHSSWYGEVMGDVPAPRLAWGSEVVGSVSEAAAAETGLPAGTPVCAGTVDAWAEALSAGVSDPGDLMVMYGSTMFFVQVVDRPAAHPLLWNTTGVMPGSRTRAAGMATSGSITTWLQDLVGGAGFETLQAEAAAVPPGSDGLLLLPYFAGERTPIFDPQASGVLAGLTLRHTRGHLLRATYEATGHAVRQIVDLLDDVATPVRRIVAVGGGTQGGLWPQIVSDVSGREQLVPTETIGASYGDALIAAVGAGLVPATTSWATEDRVVEPRTALSELYAGMHADYQALYESTRPVVHRLAELRQRNAAMGRT